MKVVILGAGRVGASVAESLVSERNDITVVDSDASALASLQAKHDLRTVLGNAIEPRVLRDAGIEDADLLIATVARDETNLVACHLAARQFNVPKRIARIRSTEFQDHPEITGDGGFYVDHLICPEQTVTSYLLKLVEFPEALQVLEFADGALSLIAVRAFAGGPLVEHPIRDLQQQHPTIDMRIVAIFRQDHAIVPDGDTRIEPGDEVFILAASRARVVVRAGIGALAATLIAGVAWFLFHQVAPAPVGRAHREVRYHPGAVGQVLPRRTHLWPRLGSSYRDRGIPPQRHMPHQHPGRL